MSKLRLILILIFIANIAYPQYVVNYKHYKLSGIPFKTYKNNYLQKDNIKIIVNPVNSKYPASNFITDIFPVGDTVWFAT